MLYRPYNDGWLIASQILAVYATALSWMYWGTFILCAFTFVLFQSLWLCRFHKAGLYVLVLLAVMSSNAMLGIGLYATYEFQQYSVVLCEPFDMYVWHNFNTNPLFRPPDECNEIFWMAVTYTSAILWALAAGCLVRFVTSGNHAKWEERHTSTAATTTSGRDDNSNNENEAKNYEAEENVDEV